MRIADFLDEAQLRTIAVGVAQRVKKPDVGALLSAVGMQDPIPEAPKRKRLVAALIASQDLEGDDSFLEPLEAAVAEYDAKYFRERVERAAEHVVYHARIRSMGKPAYSLDIDDVEPKEGAAHVGLTVWGGSGAIPRSIVLMVEESSRETQIELDVEQSGELINALTSARLQLADGQRYLSERLESRRTSAERDASV